MTSLVHYRCTRMFLKVGRPGLFILQKDSRDSSGPEKYFILYDISTIYFKSGHRYFDWDNATIKGHSNRKHSRLFLETCFTLANENSINRHIDIPEVYRAAINNIIH